MYILSRNQQPQSMPRVNRKESVIEEIRSVHPPRVPSIAHPSADIYIPIYIPSANALIPPLAPLAAPHARFWQAGGKGGATAISSSTFEAARSRTASLNSPRRRFVNISMSIRVARSHGRLSQKRDTSNDVNSLMKYRSVRIVCQCAHVNIGPQRRVIDNPRKM